MKINLTEAMRLKGRIIDIHEEMDTIFRNVNTNFDEISSNINSSGLHQSILGFQGNVSALSQKFSQNLEVLENFMDKQISSYTVTNEEVEEALQNLISKLNETFDKDGNILSSNPAITLTSYSAHPQNVVGQGTEIVIPSSVKQTGLCPNYTSYSGFYPKWNQGTAQRALADQWGEAGMPSSNGIATLNDRYLVAVSPKFGQVGDNIDIVLSDGQVINATIADMKGADATNEWGHAMGPNGMYGVDIIEWEASGSKSDINLGSWGNVTVDKIVNLNK